MIIASNLSGAIPGESSISPEQQAADLAPVPSGGGGAAVPSMPYQDPMKSGGGGTGTDWGGLTKALPGLVKAGADLIKSGQNTASGAKPAIGKAGGFTLCQEYLDKAKAFVTANKSKYDSLMAKRNAATAHVTLLAEQKACHSKYESGAFGSFKVGDTKGNVAAYAKYQACQATATAKYRTATVLTKDEALFTAAYENAKDYVNRYALAVKNGMTIVTTNACASASMKADLARLAKASAMTFLSPTTVVVGLLLVGAAGFAAWKLL